MAEYKHQRESGAKDPGHSNRGTGSMDEAKRHDVASKGGQSVRAEERSFSKDRELASEAGRKGGHARIGSADSSDDAAEKEEGGPESQRGGEGNFARDRERASEAGQKGDKH